MLLRTMWPVFLYLWRDWECAMVGRSWGLIYDVLHVWGPESPSLNLHLVELMSYSLSINLNT